MKALYKLFAILFVFAAVNTNAQQLTTPMDLRVTAPAGIAGSFDYGYPTDWSLTVLPATVQGELAWGFNATDSLGCTPITTNLAGKIALIRRGTCGFSLKAYHAQQAGAIGTIILNHTYNADGGGIVNMLGGDSASAIVTPAAFLTRDDGDIILAQLDNGTPVTAAFYIPTIDNAHAVFHYSTPQSQIQDLNEFDITVFNNSNHPETNIVATVVITDPNGVVTTLTENVANIPANSDSIISFASSYTPVDTGMYTAQFTVTADSATFNNDLITQTFEITEHTWGNDNPNEIIGSILPSGFNTTFRYDIGNTYFVGASGATATHMSFGLEAPDSVDGETFDIILYDIDANLDGTIDGTDYTAFTAVGFASYTVDAATMPANDTVVVELSPLAGNTIQLNPNGVYLLTVQYDALTSPNGNTSAPPYLFSSATNYEFLNTMVFTSQLFTGGFTGNWNAVLRLHLDGFLVSGTEDVKQLDNAKINLFPNPTTEFVTVDLELENVSEAVEIKIMDVNGRVLSNQTFNNVQNNKFTFDVKNYAAGNYFIRVQTEEGIKTKHFTIVK